MDIRDHLALRLEHFVSLQGNKDAISNPVVLQNELRGRQFNDLSFNIVYHIYCKYIYKNM